MEVFFIKISRKCFISYTLLYNNAPLLYNNAPMLGNLAEPLEINILIVTTLASRYD